MSEENVTQPEGKGMAVGGFVLSLVTLVLSSWIAVIAAASIVTGGSGWLMYLWTVLALASVVLSAMGMSKLGKTGGKKGLAIAGLVIGIVSSVWCLMLSLGLSSGGDALENNAEFQEALDRLENIEDMN